jgi:hypothetical protein
MVIAFKDNKGCIEWMYPISSISMESNAEGKPVNIVIKTNYLVLQDIAEKYCALGFNSKHPDEALYKRFSKEFIVLSSYKEPDYEYIDW